MYIEIAQRGRSPAAWQRLTEEFMHEPQSVEPGTDAPIAEDRSELIAERRIQQRALMRALGRRGISVTPEQIEKIHACRVGETLDRWIDRAVHASTASEVLCE